MEILHLPFSEDTHGSLYQAQVVVVGTLRRIYNAKLKILSLTFLSAPVNMRFSSLVVFVAITFFTSTHASAVSSL